MVAGLYDLRQPDRSHRLDPAVEAEWRNIGALRKLYAASKIFIFIFNRVVMNKRYISDWLNKYFKTVNARWSKPPQLLGRTGVLSAEQHEFQRLGEALTSRLEKSVMQECPDRYKSFQFAIVKSGSHERNAWVFWASKCYGILVTQGLIENMQVVCGQVDALMTQVMAMPSNEENFLRDLWKGMPPENTDFSSYGSMLAQIAFDFLVHHAVAHAGLGHEWILSTAAATEVAFPPIDAQKTWVLEERSESASAAAEDGIASWRQPLEADADLNGLRYTIQYIESQAKRFEEISVEPEDSMGTVWKHFMTDDHLRWFTIMAGVSIGLGCLLSDLKSGIGNLSNGSHPPLPARMLVLLHAAGQLQPSARRIKIADVLLLVTVLFGMLRTAKESKAETLESALGFFNVPEVIERFDEIGAHFESLATQMRQLHATRDHLRRFPDFLRWEWYTQSSNSALPSAATIS